MGFRTILESVGRFALRHKLLASFTVLFAAWAAWSDFGRTVDRWWDVGVCRVHHVEMPVRTVPISYGLRGWRVGERDAELAAYPNAATFVPGGCMAGWATNARVRYCPDCEKARAAWDAAHEGLPRSSSLNGG